MWTSVYGIATDSQGNVYWAGSVRGTSEFGCGTITTGSNTAGVLAKYDAAGNCLWVRSVLVTFDDAWAYDIAIDAEDRIYITGSYNGSAVFSNDITLDSYVGDDIFLARYDVDGTCLWARRAGSSSNDEARGIAFPRKVMCSSRVSWAGSPCVSIRFRSPTTTNARSSWRATTAQVR
jgi:hypothetical protein